MMEKLRQIWTLPFIILAIFGVIFFILYRQLSPLDKGENLIKEVPLPEMEGQPSEQPFSNKLDQTVRANRNTDVHRTTETSLDTSPPIDDSATDPMLEIIAPLIEDVSSFTAAKRLKRNGFLDYACQYARKAVAENPGAFEELLLLAQLLPHNGNERETTFRRLVRMDSTSVDALYGLGTTINNDQPAESVPYLKAAIAADPAHGSAYRALGESYERLGMYDEALAAYKKGSKLPPPGFDPRRWVPTTSLRHIQAIEAGNPILNPIQQESRQRLPEETDPEFPLQKEDSPPAPTEGPGRETGFDNKPEDFTPPSENGEATPAEQQAVEELIRIIEAYEASIRSKSDPSAVVEGEQRMLSVLSNPDPIEQRAT